MKPCAKNQKLLALLAIDASESRQAEKLRAHAESCPACRSYLAELSNVAGKLTASAAEVSDLETSPTFHRRLAERIEAEGRPGIGAALRAFLRFKGLNWRVAVPVAGVAIAILALMFASGPQRGRPTITETIRPIVSATNPALDLAPTFGSYRMLANRSLDALDQELTKEADADSTGTPVYTASSMPRGIAAD